LHSIKAEARARAWKKSSCFSERKGTPRQMTCCANLPPSTACMAGTSLRSLRCWSTRSCARACGAWLPAG